MRCDIRAVGATVLYLGHGVVGGRTDWTLNLDAFPFLYFGNSGYTSFQVVHLNELRIGGRR
jgi:hypothetical protein